MMSSQIILALERNALPASWLPECESLRATEPEVIEALSRCDPVWHSRFELETDPGYKQPIPYIVLTDSIGRVGHYLRRGTEQRLRGLHSIGIGGHVEPQDKAASIWETILQAMRRELQEEIPGEHELERLHFLGLINEELTEVGKVHLGFVFVLETKDIKSLSISSEIGELFWAAPARIGEFPLELWSRLALQLF